MGRYRRACGAERAATLATGFVIVAAASGASCSLRNLSDLNRETDLPAESGTVTTNAEAGQESDGCVQVFRDDFSGGFANWQMGGSGTWTLDGGELVQSDDTTDLAFLSETEMGGLDDYRVTGRMQMLSEEDGGAVELLFRQQTSNLGEMYHCNWDPIAGLMQLMISDQNYNASAMGFTQVDVGAVAAYDPHAPVTMEVDVTESTFHCSLVEIPQADLQVTDTTYTSGTFGPKTYYAAAAFDFVQVCKH